MKTTVPAKKSGAILVIVMMVVISFTLLVAALLRLGGISREETAKQLQYTQAHWLAEAGVERALSLIVASKEYRENALPDTLSDGSLLSPGKGSYNTIITSTNQPSGYTTYTITSTGTVLTKTAGVRITMDAVSGGTDALEAPGTDAVSKIAANSDITGSIDVENTLVIAKGKHDIEGIVDAGEIKKNPGAVTEGDLPDSEPPTVSDAADADFSSLLAHAADTNNADVIVGDTQASTLTYNSDGEAYVHGAVDVDKDIPAGKTIVATGSIENNKSHTDYGDGVYLVAGENVTFKNHITLGEQTVVYAQNDISFETKGATAEGTTLIAEGDIRTKNIEFKGIIYAEGEVEITSGSEIRGAVIAQEGFDLAANVIITYDPSVFPNNSLIDFKNSLVIDLNKWTWQQL